MTVSLPIGRRSTKCLVPGASAIYLCNEGAGTVLRDYSGNARDGTFGADTAAPAYSATGIEFDTDEYIDCGTWRASSADGAGLTVSAVVTLQNITGRFGILCQYNSTGDKRAWALTTLGSQIQATVGDDGTSAAGHILQVRSGGTLTTTSAHMISLVFSAGTLALYSGTTPQSLMVSVAGTPGTIYNPTCPIEFGRYLGGDYLTGTVHAATIYPSALTPAQIAQNHAAIRGILAPRGVTLA